MRVRDEATLVTRHTPYLCRHFDDDGRVKGSHQSRIWEVMTEGGNLCLTRASECCLKYCYALRGSPDVNRVPIPDPAGDAIRSHPDWDPAPPPVFHRRRQGRRKRG